MQIKKPQVLVLGTFHMTKEHELNSKKRTSELEELIEHIAKFAPTKIALEMVKEDSKYCDEKYEDYLRGNYTLEENEIFQVGFRLAAKLGHKNLFPVDWMGESEKSYGEIEEWGKINQPDLLNELYQDLSFPEWQTDKTVLSYFKELNEPAFLDKLHRLYLNIARIGDDTNYLGMDWLVWWYKRNLIMFSNISKLIESPDERILFLVGCSHSSIVTNFLEESGLCEVVNAVVYLEDS